MGFPVQPRLAQPSMNQSTISKLSPPDRFVQIQVISYNLYWWCVSDEYGTCPQYAHGKGFAEIYEKVKDGGGGPFDLVGFQECDNIGQILGGAGLAGRFDYYDAPGDAKMAWDKQKYAKIGGPGQVWVATDKYGNRYMNWVRLRVQSTGQTIFFANTHGPLNGCGTDLGQRYLGGVNGNKQPGDKVVFTGDFNCPSNTAAISIVSGAYQNAATGDSYSGADHIFTDNGVKVQWEGHRNGSPSDHSLLKAVLGVESSHKNVDELIFV